MITDEQWNPPTLGFYLQNSGGSGNVVLFINYEGASGEWQPIHVNGYTPTYVTLDFSSGGAPNEFASCTGPYFCCPYPPGPDSSPPSVMVGQVIPDNAATTENQVIYDTETNYNAYTSTWEYISSEVYVQTISQPSIDAGAATAATVAGAAAAIGIGLSSAPRILGTGATPITVPQTDDDLARQAEQREQWENDWRWKEHKQRLDDLHEHVFDQLPFLASTPLGDANDALAFAAKTFEALNGSSVPLQGEEQFDLTQEQKDYRMHEVENGLWSKGISKALGGVVNESGVTKGASFVVKKAVDTDIGFVADKYASLMVPSGG
jgi:hypothetical protein